MNNRLIKLFTLVGPIVLLSSACDRSSGKAQKSRLDVDEMESTSPVISEYHDKAGLQPRSKDEPITFLEERKGASDALAEFETSEPKDSKGATITSSVAHESGNNIMVFGDAMIPEKWFEGASDHVRAQIKNWSFTLKEIDGKNLIGVVDEDGNFVTWPGAKEFAEGEYPEGYIFIGFDDDANGAAKSNGVRF